MDPKDSAEGFKTIDFFDVAGFVGVPCDNEEATVPVLQANENENNLIPETSMNISCPGLHDDQLETVSEIVVETHEEGLKEEHVVPDNTKHR